jgi:ABC-2 type transport system permease protein
VIGALVYLFVLEPLINIIPVVQNVYPYLPGAAAAAITGATRGSGSSHLDALQGGVVLLGWGLLFALGGWIFTIRRDIP